jgi:hypothetical protein
MNWALGVALLAGAGLALRRLLRMGSGGVAPLAGLPSFRPELQSVYCPVAKEVETCAAILGIALNDAFEERSAGHPETAWHLVGLSAGEWEQLAQLVKGLLNALGKYATKATVQVPARRLMPGRFKSQAMRDFFRLPELLDVLALGPRLRFQLRIRFLRRAAEILTKEFRHTYRYMDRTEDQSSEYWNRLDVYCYDFDLLAKETLLAFGALLTSSSTLALSGLGAELTKVLQQGVRTRPVSAGEGIGSRER